MPDRSGVQTASFPRGELTARLGDALDDAFETDLDHEVQSDKEIVKLVPCQECGRPLVVNRFYAPALGRCRGCKGETGDGVASVAVPQAGRTEPSKAVNLDDVLINPGFAAALCPAHPNDPSHEMELKWVAHNDHYGPSEFMGYEKGHAVYRQLEKGETVLHQCLVCRATVSYSTTAPAQLRRVNEPRTGKSLGIKMVPTFLEIREEPA